MRDESFPPIAFAASKKIFLYHCQSLQHFFDDSLGVTLPVILVGFL